VQALATIEVGAGPRGPVSAGVALPIGAARGALSLVDARGEACPAQLSVLARWPDESVKWVLVEWIAGAAGGAFRLVPGVWRSTHDAVRLSLRDWPGGLPRDARLTARLRDGQVVAYVPESTLIEAGGPVRATLRASGRLGPLSVRTRVTLWAGFDAARVELVVRNPCAARHEGGYWDLGDPGSVLLQDLSLTLAAPEGLSVRCTPESPFEAVGAVSWSLVQASSGGEHWNSSAHQNARGVVPLRFRGWRAGGHTGLRAQPEVLGAGFGVAVERFWENFPKALEVRPGECRVGLWPAEHGDLHEIQGGEQKRHVVWLGQGTPLDHVSALRVGVQSRTEVVNAFVEPDFGPSEADAPAVSAVHSAFVDEHTGIAARRERVDEFGWRHWGELWADHDASRHAGPAARVSHSNNEGDALYALLLAFLRTGDARFWWLAAPLADHVSSVDLYHTTEDAPGRSGGLFPPTAQGLDAATATHRGASKAHTQPSLEDGPTPRHCPTAGLRLFAQLSGDWLATEAVLSLARWLEALDDGRHTPYGLVSDAPTGAPTRQNMGEASGPGRAAAASVGACCDAFALSGDAHWLVLAERWIQRCVHPERAWSFDADFAVALSRYLEVKSERAAFDAAYLWARACIERGARDAALSEQLSELSGEVALKGAQALAALARFVPPPARTTLTERASALLERGLGWVARSGEPPSLRSLVRSVEPIVAVAATRAWPERSAPHAPEGPAQWPTFQAFVPQNILARRAIVTPNGALRALGALTKPKSWRALRGRW